MDPKILFIMIDGLADSGNTCSGGATYIESSLTPNLDKLLSISLSGLMDPVETGLACGSDTAHMSIFGYSPYQYYQGRGSFETIGSGLEMDADEIAFKCNFATYEAETGIVLKRRVSRKFYNWGLDMINAINHKSVPGFEEYRITVKHATEHRCGLKITGPGLSHLIEGTDPLQDNKPLLRAVALDPGDPKAVKTAQIVNAVSEMIIRELSTHPINLERIARGKSPANVILLRGAGVKLNVRSFDDMYGLKSFFIAPTAIIKGWGMTIGSKIVEVDGATGDVHSNHQAKFDTAIGLLKNSQEGYNFGFLHIKAIDDLGHDKNFTDRVRIFEKIDGMIGRSFEELENTIVVVTGDHCTNISIGDHSYEPVPFVIAWTGNSERMRSGDKYSEVNCARGTLGRFPGSEVMGCILRYREYIIRECSTHL